MLVAEKHIIDGIDGEVAETCPVNAPLGGEHPAWSRAEVMIAQSLIVIGVAIRLALYVANRSLWGDEASLAVNLVGRSFSQLRLPLDFEQGAPLGFLFIERSAVLLLGDSEFSLRLVPFLSSILFLGLFLRILRKYFSARMGLAAMAMAVFSKSLIHYSVELKQYSSDVAISSLILYFAMRIGSETDESKARRVTGMFAALGALAVWFSHPSVFVLAGVGSVLVFGLWRKGADRLAMQIACATAVGVVSAFCQYLFFARALTHDSYLATFWAAGMMPLYPPLSALRWLATALPESLQGLFGKTGVALTILFLLIGCLSLVRRGRWILLGLVIVPVVCTLAASAIHQYPFADRMILFLYPLLIVVVAAGFEGMHQYTPHRWKWIAWIFLAALLVEPVVVGIKAAFVPPLKEQLKPLLAYLNSQRQAEDIVYVTFKSRPAFEYYAHRYGFDRTQACLGSRSNTYESIDAEMSQFRGQHRVWVLRTIVNAHVEQSVVAALKHLRASTRDERFAKGVRLGLYDLGINESIP